MFRHIVLVRFRDGLGDEERDRYRQAIEGLVAATPSVLGFSCGMNVGTGPNHHDFGAVTDFPDEAAFRAYLASPAHQDYVINFGRPMVERLAVIQQVI
jgi:quinol monooxygenase YgiN